MMSRSTVKSPSGQSAFSWSRDAHASVLILRVYGCKLWICNLPSPCVSETYIRLLSSPTTTTVPEMSVPKVSTEHPKSSQDGFHQDNVHRIYTLRHSLVMALKRSHSQTGCDRESLERVNATSTRTAEVTIPIALDSYRITSQYCIIPLIGVFLSRRDVQLISSPVRGCTRHSDSHRSGREAKTTKPREIQTKTHRQLLTGARLAHGSEIENIISQIGHAARAASGLSHPLR